MWLNICEAVWGFSNFTALLQKLIILMTLPSRAVHAALAALPPAPSPFDVFLGEYLRISPLRLSV